MKRKRRQKKATSPDVAQTVAAPAEQPAAEPVKTKAVKVETEVDKLKQKVKQLRAKNHRQYLALKQRGISLRQPTIIREPLKQQTPAKQTTNGTGKPITTLFVSALLDAVRHEIEDDQKKAA